MSTNSSNSLQINREIAQNMIASRLMVRQSDVDQTRRFHIRGNGNIIAVLDKDKHPVLDKQTGMPLQKIIYGIKANSHIAMLNPRNQEILRTAAAAEHEGDEVAAHSAYNDYLNKIQVSFSVILNPGRKQHSFSDGQLVEGEIELVTTENGQMLTVKNVRPVAVEKLSATPKFSLGDLMGIDTKVPTAETVLQPIDGATAGTGATAQP